MIEQLSSIQEVHHKVQFSRSLESVMQLNYKRTVNFLKDVSLSLSFDEKISLGNDIFAKLLHSIVVISSIPSTHVDFAKRSPTNDLYKLKVAETDFFIDT